MGKKRDGLFTIKDTIARLKLKFLAYSQSLDIKEFYADTVKSITPPDLILDPVQNPIAQDSVFFQPTQTGPHIGRIPIFWNNLIDFADIDTPIVVLLGIGIAPTVSSKGYAFGPLRVDSSSNTQTIYIVNSGSDSTAVDSVTIVDSSSIANFTLSLDTLPFYGAKSPALLDYSGGESGGDTILSFTVQFRPLSLGADTLILRIHTVDDTVLFDTLSGMGVEPRVTVNPKVIYFDTIFIQKGTAPLTDTIIPFQISDSGTFAAELDTIYNSDTTNHFSVSITRFASSPERQLPLGGIFYDTIKFSPTDEGNFVDTVYVVSNTRYGLYPQGQDTVHEIILKAEVRTGPIGGDSISFGTITTCDPIADSVSLLNPYPVEIHIDSVKFLADSGGFSILRNDPTKYRYPINIPPNDSLPLNLIYSFPPDSLNGTQLVKFVLFQRSGEGERPILDTETVYVERKQRVFALNAVAPAFVASADDVSPLRLPITVSGARAGVTELNSWTLSLQFSNDVFEPVRVDTTGALAVPMYDSSDTSGRSYSLTKHWDQPSRTYTIIVTGSAVSDSAKIGNDLLLTLELQAYLTTDTVVTVTPTFTWTEHPCAYNLQTFTLDVPYANDCGDQTTRDAMLGQAQAISIISVWPNPADGAGDVSVEYKADEPVAITCIVFDETGQEIGRINESLPPGNGMFAIPAGMLPKSGPAYVRVEAVLPEQAGSTIAAQSFKIEVAK